jgi:hypothetical protein
MDPNALAGMVFTLALFALVGGLILLYPVAKHLGHLLEAKVREQNTRTSVRPERVDEALRLVLERMEALSERQDFLEQVLARREPDLLGVPKGVEGAQSDRSSTPPA